LRIACFRVAMGMSNSIKNWCRDLKFWSEEREEESLLNGLLKALNSAKGLLSKNLVSNSLWF